MDLNIETTRLVDCLCGPTTLVVGGGPCPECEYEGVYAEVWRDFFAQREAQAVVSTLPPPPPRPY